MEKIRFGKTGLMVTKIALGGIPIMRVGKDYAVKLVREALELGINFIDTANAYADSEEKIGEGIRGIKREDLIIASKSMANDKKTFNEHLDLSLKQLKLDYLDIYQLHNIGTKQRRDAVFAPGGAYEGLQEAVKAGKVRFPGFSSHKSEFALELMKSGKFSVVQYPFNFIDDAAEKEIIPLSKKLDIGFISMKPMGGGLLDNAGLSFRYLMQFDNIVPDPGVEKIEEIREIVSIVKEKKPLTAEDKKAIEKIRCELGKAWCHRCDYCQPCPQGVPISSVLSLKSMKKRFSDEVYKSLIGANMEKARACKECGECMPRCPYHLEIPKLIKENLAIWDKE